MKQRTRILKLKSHDESREIDFELASLQALTVAQRFRLMRKKTQEILRLLKQSGHRRPPGVFERSGLQHDSPEDLIALKRHGDVG